MEKKRKKNKPMFVIGIIMIVLGVGVLSFYGYRKISRELYLRKLLKENINFEIPSLDIKVPVLEGTGTKQLQVSAGHFEGKVHSAREITVSVVTTARSMRRFSMTLIRYR